jgi:DNA repair exonuclease SbcCD ATPase subunit/DNA repair exonuclease SbcCD nuclease subunit
MPKLAFVSDVHWRGITRHDEYTQVFTELFRQLREEVKPDYILCGGDIFHTKTQNITPEVIEKITWMFNELALIAPVYSILGNHDGNLTNDNRQDTISPIVAAINNPRIVLFKKSGNWIIPRTNINLCVLSCFDEAGWNNVQTDEDLINVAMFHGSVRGCKTDSDWVMSHGEAEISMFERFDFALLGDIHHSQFLSERPCEGNEIIEIDEDDLPMKPWIGYPGSLIQQNYGEDVVKGYHVWDIRSADDWDVTFHQVANDYQFITVDWKGDVASTVSEALKVAGKTLQHKRVRIVSDQTVFHLQMKELYDELKNKHKASEVVFKAGKNENISESGSDEDTHQKATSLRNSPELLCELYDSFVEKDYKIALSSTQKDEAKAYVQKSLEKVRQLEDDVARDVVWSIKDMEFSNLYRYGEGNRIDFSNLNGITGIFGPNKVGKSSIVGSLMFGLFNTTDRGPVKSSYIINKNKREGYARVTINVSGTDYVVERSVAKASKRGGRYDDEKAATKLCLSRLESDGTEVELVSENSESRTDTDKVVRKLIGTSQDFLLTAFSNQGGMNRFIDEGATQRKAILNRFLDLDIFEKLYKMGNEELQKFNTLSSKFRNVNWNEAKSECQASIDSCNQDIFAAKQDVDNKKERLEKLRGWLQRHGADKQADLRRKVAEASNKCERIQGKLANRQVELDGHNDSCNNLREKLQEIKQQLANMQLAELEEKAGKLKKLGESYNDLKVEVSQEQQKLAVQVKSIKKLDMVPCGDSFPTCHYIKDSHADKATHEAQKKLVEDILATYETVKADFDALQQEKIEEQIKVYRRWEKELESNEQKLSFSETLMKGCIETIASLQQELEAAKTEHVALVEELNKQEDLGSSIEEERVLATTIRDMETKLQQLYVKLGGYTNKLEQLSKEAEEAAKIIEEQKVYDSIVQAFSKNGIPAYVLKNKLPEINAELNNILAGIVSFRIFLETEVGSNTLDVFIEDKDSRRVIELASGMEKMIASLAIRVALISLSSLPKPDIFIIDEGWGVLDANNVGKVLELLQSIKTRFKSMIVISHIDAVKEVANSMITIYDNGNESSVNC